MYRDSRSLMTTMTVVIEFTATVLLRRWSAATNDSSRCTGKQFNITAPRGTRQLP
jgi:hypothetical protein